MDQESTGEQSEEYVAFISYRHSDASRPQAEALEAALKAYAKPFWKPPIAIFRDERVLQPGDNLPAEIRKALESSQFLLYIASKEAAESKWVQEELRIWCQELGRADRLLIVHINDRISSDPATKAIAWGQTDVLPEILKPYVHSIPVWTDLSWAITPQQRSLKNDKYKQRINALVARFRGKKPGEMNDEAILTHRRNIVLRNGGIVIVVLLGLVAGYFGYQSRKHQREVELAEAFRQLDRGEVAPEAAVHRLRQLGLDPLMALHYSHAAESRTLSATPIADAGEASYIRISRDGDLIVVVYDYQSAGGDPDIETIPEWTAVGLYQLSSRKWILTHDVGSAIGRRVYDMYSSDVVGLEAPHHLILRQGGDGDPETFVRFSLADGGETPCDQRICGEYAAKLDRSLSQDVPERLKTMLDPSNLFNVRPEDGLDEYSPRLVEQVFVTSPDRRTAVVGTYEGRLLLLDLDAGLVRGDGRFGPIFAAAYRHDGTRAYFCDGNHLFEIETPGWPGLRERSFPLRTGRGHFMQDERTLAVVFSEDASLLAMATNLRLIAFIMHEDRWVAWNLPKEIEKAAALRVDSERGSLDLAVGDDGTLISGDVRRPSSPLKVSPSPTAAQPTVAWLDVDRPAAWVAASPVVDGSVRVRLVPMPGRTITPIELTVRLAAIEQDQSIDSARAVHAIARIEDELVLFYGDADSYSDREMWDERMAIVSTGRSTRPSDHEIFSAESFRDNLGEAHWSCEYVEWLLPGSRKERMLAYIGGSEGVVVIKPDGSNEPALGSLCTRDYVDGDQTYSLGVEAGDADPWFTIKHFGSGSTVRRRLPWRFKATPAFAAISQSGRQAAVVSTEGHVLFIDVEPGPP